MSLEAFRTDGFALVPGVLAADECRLLAEGLGTRSAGTRCLLQNAWCAELASRLRAHTGLTTLIPADHVAVQCTLFEKSAEQNWLVPVHQDLSIPVAERVAAPGLSGWSEKEGMIFVQAPVAILEQLVAVRLHLDRCGPDDGPLRLIPGTHRQGCLEPELAVSVRQARGESSCEAESGDALVMRPLLLHASSKSRGSSTSRRRVLHFVFAPRQLTHGLRWQQAF